MKQLQNKGILYMLCSLMIYSVITVCNKRLIKTAYFDIWQIFFMSSLFALISSSLYLKFIKKEPFYKTTISNINGEYCMRAVFNLLARYSFLYALIEIDATIAASLLYFRPIFALLIGIYFVGEKLTKRVAFALALSLIGAFIITGPVAIQKVNVIPMIAAFISPLMWAGYDVIVKKQTKTAPAYQQVYLLFLLLCVLSLPLAIKYWVTPKLEHVILFMFLGIGYALTEFTLSKALKGITLAIAAPISFTRVIFTATLASLVIGEKITINILIGSAIIIMATFFLLRPKVAGLARSNAAD